MRTEWTQWSLLWVDQTTRTSSARITRVRRQPIEKLSFRTTLQSSLNRRCQGNYIYDFLYTSENEIPLDGEIILRNANLETCSRSCVTADNFLCKSFDFCAETKTCMLNSEIAQKPAHQNQGSTGAQAAIQKDKCRTYVRKWEPALKTTSQTDIFQDPSRLGEYYFLTSVRNNLDSGSDASESE